jgi:hypothetical protein
MHGLATFKFVNFKFHRLVSSSLFQFAKNSKTIPQAMKKQKKINLTLTTKFSDQSKRITFPFFFLGSSPKQSLGSF